MESKVFAGVAASVVDFPGKSTDFHHGENDWLAYFREYPSLSREWRGFFTWQYDASHHGVRVRIFNKSK